MCSPNLLEEMSLYLRKAEFGDSESLAALSALASGDILQFLIDDLSPNTSVYQLCLHASSNSSGNSSYNNCVVCLNIDCIVGGLNYISLSSIELDSNCTSHSVREAHLFPRIASLKFCDANSILINYISVFYEFQGLGVGTFILNNFIQEMRSRSYSYIYLHVWADNLPAIHLYRKCGFSCALTVNIPWHPALPHKGGSLLMKMKL